MNAYPKQELVFVLAIFLSFPATDARAGGQYPDTLLHALSSPSTNLQQGAELGFAVAVDGQLTVVGAPYDDTGGGVKVYATDAGSHLYTITNPSLSTYSGFGIAVAISGTRMVVGAPFDYGGISPKAGAAYVYDLAGSTPLAPTLTLTNPSPAPQENFGGSVGISGSKVVIGGAGSVYVYDLSSPAPTLPTLTLTNPTPAVDDSFGYGVGIFDNRVAVGAPGDDVAFTDNGIAFVYDLTSGKPTVPVLTLTNPGPAAADSFGASVCISGTRVAVGARQDSGYSGSVYIYDVASATPGFPITTLTNPHISTALFGSSVAMSGARIVVGAYFDDTGAAHAGRAYTYDLDSPTPTVPILTMNSPSPATNKFFGFAVAISGTRAVIGAPGDHPNFSGLGDGAAYIYDLTNAAPGVPSATIIDPGPTVGDAFGTSVAISGDRVFFGSPGANDAGCVYVFDLNSRTPTNAVLGLTNPAPADPDKFGFSLAVSGTRVAVSAPTDSAAGFGTGSAYVFDLANATPTSPVATITNPAPTGGYYFGISIAISGTRVVAGSPFDDTGAANAGSAYVYDLASATPAVPALTVTNPAPAKLGEFGYAVAISERYLVVGAISDGADDPASGSAYIYDLATSTPADVLLTLTNPTPAVEDLFGIAVAISGKWVVVGASYDDTGAPDSGSAYVYDLASTNPTVPMLTLTNSNPSLSAHFGGSVAISGALVVVGAELGNAGATNSGIAYVYDLANANPTVPVAVLAKPGAARGDGFGRSVAVDGDTVVIGAPNDDAIATDKGAGYVFGLRPKLDLVRPSPGVGMISWSPATSSGFVLQYKDAPFQTSWLNAMSGATNPVSISLTNSSRYYRLLKR